MFSPTLDQELHHQLHNLSLTQQRQVLDFARALSLAQPHAVPGSALLPFAGTIAPDDLAIMAQAAEPADASCVIDKAEGELSSSLGVE